jgi:hypothetical protein
VIWLTRREQRAVALVMTLLVVGWAVKSWRSAQDPAASDLPAIRQH